MWYNHWMYTMARGSRSDYLKKIKRTRGCSYVATYVEVKAELTWSCRRKCTRPSWESSQVKHRVCIARRGGDALRNLRSDENQRTNNTSKITSNSLWFNPKIFHPYIPSSLFIYRAESHFAPRIMTTPGSGPISLTVSFPHVLTLLPDTTLATSCHTAQPAGRTDRGASTSSKTAIQRKRRH